MGNQIKWNISIIVLGFLRSTVCRDFLVNSCSDVQIFCTRSYSEYLDSNINMSSEFLRRIKNLHAAEGLLLYITHIKSHWQQATVVGFDFNCRLEQFLVAVCSDVEMKIILLSNATHINPKVTNYIRVMRVRSLVVRQFSAYKPCAPNYEPRWHFSFSEAELQSWKIFFIKKYIFCRPNSKSDWRGCDMVFGRINAGKSVT